MNPEENKPINAMLLEVEENTSMQEPTTVLNAVLACGINQNQIALIIKSSKSHVSMVLKGQRMLTFEQQILLTRFKEKLIANNAIELPVEWTTVPRKTLDEMYRNAMYDMETLKIESENIQKEYSALGLNLANMYCVVKNEAEYDLMIKDYVTLRKINRYKKLNKRRLDIFLEIKKLNTYIQELKEFIQMEDVIYAEKSTRHQHTLHH